MIFDITSQLTSREFLCSFLEIDNKEVDTFIEKVDDHICVDSFLDYVGRSLENRDISDMYLSVIHITTNDDECQTIRDIGLVNLQQALTMDTPLRRYLKRYNIQFDIYNHLMCINNNCHEITYDSSFFETETAIGKLNSVARKIYFDHQINGFFCVRDAKGYGGYVHLRPEIIYDIAQLGSNPYDFERMWIQNNKPYLIKFNAPVEYFTYYSFYGDIDEFKEDYGDKMELKKWLVKNALLVNWEYYNFGECPHEIMAYLKPEVSIPFKLITDIQPIL
ncbi:hypothetical protein [Dethiothermospora halolimnae]|uniref:hypothetical protein n=1 Tax=Dethiothermospora halolimnae TaxID=3114390 RepID=UPI003CCBC129